MRHHSLLRVSAGLTAACLALAPALAGTFTYATIPSVDQNGEPVGSTTGAGINDSGVVVGTANASSGLTTAVIWSPGNSYVTSYQSAANESTAFNAINDSGLVAGYYKSKSGILGFVYNSTSGVQQNIDLPAKDGAFPPAINASGEVAGRYDGDRYAFVSINGTATRLNPKGSFEKEAFATGINDSGVVVGQFTTKKTPRALVGFSYNGTAYTNIVPPGSTATFVGFITDGGILGGYYRDSSDVYHGFTFDGTTYTTMDYPGAASSSPVGVGPGGEVVGNWTDSSGNQHGYVFTGGTYYDIDVPGGYTQTVLSGINSQGTLVGTAYESTTAFYAFTATCPSGQSPCT